MRQRLQSLSSLRKSQNEIREFLISSMEDVPPEEDHLSDEEQKTANEIKSVENSRKYIPRVDLS
jgi:hypothetical protein